MSCFGIGNLGKRNEIDAAEHIGNVNPKTPKNKHLFPTLTIDTTAVSVSQDTPSEATPAGTPSPIENGHTKSVHLEVPKPEQRKPVHSLQYSDFPTLEPERRAKKRLSFIIILSIFALFVFNGLDGTSKYHLFAYLLAVLMLLWNILFYSILLSSKHLHMIYVKRRRVNNSQFLFVPYQYVENEHRLITSVSSINAISGSNAERYSLLTMYVTFGVSYCAICSKWTEEGGKSSQFTQLDIEMILAMIGSIGLLMIATWGLEPRTFSQIVHYIAAGATCLGSPLAFAMQQQFNWFSIAVMSITYLGLIEWGILMFNLPKKHDDLKVVHKLSKISIINEAIVIMMSYGCSVMYVYNL